MPERANPHQSATTRPGARAEQWAAWLLVAPAMLGKWILLLGPAIAVLLLSMTDWDFGAPEAEWIGLGNYRAMAVDRVFWTSLRNTLVYAGTVVPLTVGLGLGAALLIEGATRFRAFYRAAFFMPVASTLLAMALVWEFMFHPSAGVINKALLVFGLQGQDWLRNPDIALFALAAIGIWQGLGLAMVLFMAGLKSIPPDLYEALALDGADGAWERFRRVTWPMLGPALVFVVSITAIRSFQVFDTVAVITKGGPNKATEVLLYTMVQEGFTFLRSGYAAALTAVFLLIAVTLTLLQTWLLDRRAHYG